MKKQLLKSFAVMVMALGASTWTFADNVVYGLIMGDGSQAVSVDFDQLSTTAKTKVTKGFNFDNFAEVKGGATAVDKYFAFGDITDPETGDVSRGLVTLNFTNGKMTVVNNNSFQSSDDMGYNTTALAYDDVSEALYAMELVYEDDGYKTKIYAVDQETGKFTWKTEYDGEYQGLSSDHKGNLFLMKNTANGMNQYPNLYKIDATWGISEYFTNNEVGAWWPTSTALVISADGKTAYAVEGSNIITIDLETKKAATAGSLVTETYDWQEEANVETPITVFGLTYGKGTADGQENAKPGEKKEQTRFLIKTETFGDRLGMIPTSVTSDYTNFYYNVDGTPVGSLRMGREVGNTGYLDTFAYAEMQKAVFDEFGNRTSYDNYLWGQYDGDEYVWNKQKTSESYTYDEAGNLITKETYSKKNVYSYNEDGTLATEEVYSKSRNAENLLQTITYDEYDNNGNVLHTSSTGAEYFTYDTDYEYDEDGNKTSEYQYKLNVKEDDGNEIPQAPYQLKTWTYENGYLTTYMEQTYYYDSSTKTYVDNPTIKVTYTPVDGNNDVVDVMSYVYFDGTWGEGGQPSRYYYRDFTDAKENTYMELIAEEDETLPNTVNLMFTIPQWGVFGKDCKFVIYRDVQPIDTVGVFDVLDDEIGMCKYQDKDLKNGTYTYFIQPIFADQQGGGDGPLAADADIDDPMGGDDSEADDREFIGYFVTNPVEATVNVELPGVTDLALASARQEVVSLVSGEVTTYAGLTWKNPANMSDYGFVRNDIYVNDGRSEAALTSVTDATAETGEFPIEEDVTVRVRTIYQTGSAWSEPVEVKIKDVKALLSGTGIETLGDGKTTVAFNGKTISLSDNANVTVYSANGQQVFNGANVNSVSLTANGAYVICVEKNGKVNVYKYNAK